TDNKILQIICSHQLVTMYNIVANYDKSIEVLDKIIEIIDELENDYFKSVMLTETGFVYFRKGEYEKLLDYTKKSLEVKERIGNERLIAQSYGYLGVYHGITGNTKEALEYTIKAHKILTENGKKSDNSTWLNNLAIFLYDLGELDKAIDHMERLYEILKKDKRELASMYVLANVASFYIQKGELDKALELESQCLDFFERIGDKNRIYWDLYTISTIYEKKGLVNKALEYLERAQKIILQIGNKTLIAGLFYRFVTLASKYNKLELAKEYYKKLEEIVEDIEYKNIKRLILIAEGIILKNSKDSRERDRAEVLFDHLLQEELEISLTIEVLLQLSELLLTELKETSNERYLTKLQKNVSKLVEIGTEANLPEVIIESLWFKSQLSLLMMDIDKARELLTQALDIAERKGYNKLALKITKAKEQLIKQKMELDELEKEAPTISKRMEVVKVENGFKELKQKEIFEYNIEKIDPSKKLFSIKI
ncbi:MAG: tetratricopeptide repeat protein, partial [Candidatus Heimdallarchaeota archaeon]|nr:tetratricopeptide repeat protein [Candidatus Heimdallarchaeota archaeon]MCK4877635.1 tetratricopeptide repeat protein [Candidatus Heimdallarchaeota archaeon]